MNYRTLKTSKPNSIDNNFNINAIKDIVAKKLLNLSKHFVSACKSVLHSLLTPTKYVYDERTDTCRPCNDNYYFRDITDLQLRASRRTFL